MESFQQSTETTYKKTEFRRYFAHYLLIPVLSLLVFAVFSSLLAHHYVRQMVVQNNASTINSMSEYMEQTLNNCEQFNYGYTSSIDLNLMLRNIFRSETKDYEISSSISVLQSMMSAQSMQPHIHSIYIYYNNPYGRFLTASEKYYSYLETYYDTEWYTLCLEHADETQPFSVLRMLKRYEFEPKATPVITYFIPIKNTRKTKNMGYGIVNLSVDYLLESLNNTLPSREDGQLFAILNEKNEVLLQSPQLDFLQTDFSFLQDNHSHNVRIGKANYITTFMQSDKNQWRYYLFTPRIVYYRIPMLVLSLILLFVIVLIGIAIPLENKLIQSQLTERKYRMQTLELLALQSQINPHFLFNTLHFINWNVISLTKGPNGASEMLENLSTILNYSLREPMQAVLLSEEIHCALCYMDIIHARFPDSFLIQWEFNEPLPELKTPKLLLQPLIENCIVHGIRSGHTLLHISIRIQEQAQGLLITVADDGQGIEAGRMQEIRRKLADESYSDPSHVGLFNIAKRLRLFYGSDYSLTIDSNTGEGTTVSISLPYTNR
mgnify:CR=1 FL=1